MAGTTGPILAVGAITMARDILIDGEGIEWRVPVATGIAAIMFAGAEKVVGRAAVGVAYLALITVVFTRAGGRESPAEAFLKKWNEG